MAYNMTWLDNTTTFSQMVTNVNTLTGNTFGIYLLIFTFILCFSLFKDYDIADNMMVSTFVVIMVGLLLLAVGMMGWEILILPVVMFIAFFMVKMFRKD